MYCSEYSVPLAEVPLAEVEPAEELGESTEDGESISVGGNRNLVFMPAALVDLEPEACVDLLLVRAMVLLGNWFLYCSVVIGGRFVVKPMLFRSKPLGRGL